MDSIATQLRTPPHHYPELMAELQPWVDAFARGADDLRAMAEYLRDPRSSSPGDLLARRRLLGGTHPQVFGDVLDMALTELADATGQLQAGSHLESS